MTTPTIRQRSVELADVARAHAESFVDRFGPLPLQVLRALYDIVHCHTAAMGGHLELCRACGVQRQAYNSCRNRHCPKCQGTARHNWVAAREADLLPVPYFHVVFTLPHALRPLALHNQRQVCDLLFRTAAATLKKVAADPRHLGANIGFTAVLHTWGQKLDLHPHLHCVVPAGGLSEDGTGRIHGDPQFFLPVRVMSSVFRAKFLEGLYHLDARGELRLEGQMRPWRSKGRFGIFLSRVKSSPWVVYSKPPFGGPRQVIRYLGRYTHRTAISNSRLVAHNRGRVTFTYKDYSDDNRTKSMTLPGLEFLRRFAFHILPPGFVRIRHYGLLANADRNQRLARCRSLLVQSDMPLTEPAPDAEDTQPTPEPTAQSTPPPFRCPECGSPQVEVRDVARRQWIAPIKLRTPALWDTS